MRAIFFIIISFILSILLLINNFFDNKKRKYIISIIIAIVGLVIYSYAYYCLGNKDILSLFISLIKSVSAIFKMFAGDSLLSDVEMQKVFAQNSLVISTIYYLIHILAFTITISTIILATCKRYVYKLYKKIKLLNPKENIYVFYKYNEITKKLLSQLSKNKRKNTIIILDNEKVDHIEVVFNDLIGDKSYLILNESIANELHKIFTNELYKHKRIKLFALNDDIYENYIFVKKMYETIHKKTHNSITLTILSDDQIDLTKLQENNGFDYVRSFNKKDIIARSLVKEYSPCNYVEFEDCKAKDNESFNCLIIGFGELGQKILKRLFAYGQFVNCKFNCDIIDENYDNVCAEFESEFDFVLDDLISKNYSFITDNVNIRHSSINARSKVFYEFITKNVKNIDYIVVSTSSNKTNNEIVKNLLYLKNKFDNIDYDVFDCLDDRIYVYQHGLERIELNIFNHILDDSIDMPGKLINYAYTLSNSEDISKIGNIDYAMPEIYGKWNRCNSYSKNSSINAAEFYQTIIKVIGKEESCNYNEIIDYISNLSKKQKNYLGQLEHNRWSAFMLLEGYRYMDYDNNFGHKNDKKKLHACLIPYEKLDDLDKIEEKTTGKNPNYKEKDIKNVIMAIRIAELINKNFKEINNYELH
mgnify:CR=1 FL=1